MPQRRNNPNNQFVKKANPGSSTLEDGPWNKSQIEIEPSEDSPQAPIQGPRERFSDRIKIDQDHASERGLKGWTGIKRA